MYWRKAQTCWPLVLCRIIWVPTLVLAANSVSAICKVTKVTATAYLPNHVPIAKMRKIELGPNGVRVIGKYLEQRLVLEVHKGMWIERYWLIKYQVVKVLVGYYDPPLVSFIVLVRSANAASGVNVKTVTNPFKPGQMLFTMDGHRPVNKFVHYKIEAYKVIDSKQTLP